MLKFPLNCVPGTFPVMVAHRFDTNSYTSGSGWGWSRGLTVHQALWFSLANELYNDHCSSFFFLCFFFFQNEKVTVPTQLGGLQKLLQFQHLFTVRQKVWYFAQTERQHDGGRSTAEECYVSPSSDLCLDATLSLCSSGCSFGSFIIGFLGLFFIPDIVNLETSWTDVKIMTSAEFSWIPFPS